MVETKNANTHFSERPGPRHPSPRLLGADRFEAPGNEDSPVSVGDTVGDLVVSGDPFDAADVVAPITQTSETDKPPPPPAWHRPRAERCRTVEFEDHDPQGVSPAKDHQARSSVRSRAGLSTSS